MYIHIHTYARCGDGQLSLGLVDEVCIYVYVIIYVYVCMYPCAYTHIHSVWLFICIYINRYTCIYTQGVVIGNCHWE